MKLSELIEYAETELQLNGDANIRCYLSMKEKRVGPNGEYSIEEGEIDDISFHNGEFILECSE